MKEVLQVQKIESDIMGNKCELNMLRCDLFDPDIPGNKFWKMKYNIKAMMDKEQNHMVTFGGAFSNHIAATAAAGKKYGFKTTGIIRGEASSISNHTLTLARENGMDFFFIDRTNYRSWKKGEINLDDFMGFKNYYLLPEGGSNELAVKGCSEILDSIENNYDLITCPVGSGGTLSGIIAASDITQNVLGFSSLKGGEYIENDVKELLVKYDEKLASKHNWSINHEFHFGGFAKAKKELIDFFHEFKDETKIELDLIYTAKMMFGLKQMIESGRIVEGSSILAIHTGGQQGNESMLKRFS